MCKEKPQIAFKTILWTFDPRKPPGYRNIPFITRPAQDEAIDAIKDAIDNSHDLLIDKSRDEGATCLITGVFFLYWLLVPESMFLVGSRKEEFVDKSGDHKCLFYKFQYLAEKLPSSLRPMTEKTHLHYANLYNGSVIDGEATNPSMGAGDRRLSVLIDEFGRVDHSIAQSIRETLSDTTDCVIYNSTHFFGRGHPFWKLRASGKIKVHLLPWWKNPVKNAGLYKSPDLNVIELADADYYKNAYSVNLPSRFKLSEIEVVLLSEGVSPDISFVADGSNKWRSPFYDAEEKRRDPRDVAQNLDMNPMGAGDMFFDPQGCQRIRAEHIRKPDFTGEIRYKLNDKDRIRDIKFGENVGRNRFFWWGQLEAGRPKQDHNYIVACDISLGTGASNSVAGVFDVNTHEQVGMFVCPNTPPESFADQVIAICLWCGGATKKAYLIWDGTGVGGSFDRRVWWHGYNFVYTRTDERILYRPKSKTRGYHFSRESKLDLLTELRIALNEGLKKDSSHHKAIILHDENTVREVEDYIFYENGDIGLSGSVDEPSGARAAHGDRVIACGLYVVALSEQPKAALKEKIKLSEGSFGYRIYQRKIEAEKSRGSSPWII